MPIKMEEVAYVHQRGGGDLIKVGGACLCQSKGKLAYANQRGGREVFCVYQNGCS